MNGAGSHHGYGEGIGSEPVQEERQVQVRFTTKLPPELTVTSAPIAVPARLTRYGLSEVINTLLSLDTPKPFDFLVEGELLRSSLEKLLLLRKLSAESILTVEYIPAVGPPTPQTACSHEDWVSAVDGSRAGSILSGSYDGLSRLWSENGESLTSLSGHTDVVTSISILPNGEDKDSAELSFLTASKDRSIRLWTVQGSEGWEAQVFQGHTDSVQAVAASPSGQEFCSGSWDRSIKVWNFEQEEVAPKKRKTSEQGSAEDSVAGEALATLTGHSQCVSAVAWLDAKTLWSASWDHSLRCWDIPTAINTATITGPKALHCMSLGGNFVAAGGADSVLRIWDPRTKSTAPAIQLHSHKGWITAVKWHPRIAQHLLSASHDGTVKLWDMRGKIPLSTIMAHKDKVLCADWFQEDGVVSGGADCTLQIHKVPKTV